MADQTVVSATIFPGPSGSITHPDVTLNQLDSCSIWNGAYTMGLYAPNRQSFSETLAVNSTWSLETVLTCALQLSLSDITEVIVQRADHSWGAPLTPANLSDEAQYNDPLSAKELPVVSVNGVSGVEYVRPWRGGSDNNSIDWIPANGPPTNIQVYENGSPPLNVTASDTVSGSTVSFSASVQGVPASDLTWDWSFGDGRGSSQQNPTYTYTSSGLFVVTLNVADARTNQGGTATVSVNIGPQGGPGTTPQSGAGSTTPTTGAPSGPTNTKGSNPGTSPGTTPAQPGSPQSAKHGKHGGSNPKRSAHKHKTNHKSTTTTTTPTAAVGSGSSGQGGGSGQASSGGASGGNHAATAPKSGPAGSASLGNRGPRFVSGRLISNLTPVAPDRSPLVHVVPAGAGTAPQVRRAIVASTVPVLLGILVVVLLLFLGAGRELVWRGGWRIAALRRLREAVS